MEKPNRHYTKHILVDECWLSCKAEGRRFNFRQCENIFGGWSLNTWALWAFIVSTHLKKIKKLYPHTHILNFSIANSDQNSPMSLHLVVHTMIQHIQSPSLSDCHQRQKPPNINLQSIIHHSLSPKYAYSSSTTACSLAIDPLPHCRHRLRFQQDQTKLSSFIC